MNRFLISAVLIVGIAIGLLVTGIQSQALIWQRWEYMTVERTGRLYQFDPEEGEFINLLSMEDEITDIKYAGRNDNAKLTIMLATVGAAGWELSAVEGDLFIFKRPKAAG